MTNLRIGHGFDVHAFAPERKLILCGVEIPYTLGLAGHSDADVAIHALMDSILGALALDDIGQWFPDNDDAYLGISSVALLEKLLADPRVSCWQIVNCDLCIMAQKPKLLAYRRAMREKLAATMKLPVEQVSVKFTTTEKLGFVGREEGIAVSASVLLERK